MHLAVYFILQRLLKIKKRAKVLSTNYDADNDLVMQNAKNGHFTLIRWIG